MKITIKYFGKLTDITGIEEEEMKINENTLLSDVEETLYRKYASLFNEQFACFRNNSIVRKKKLLLKGNDEICLMPPFSGG